MKQKLNEISRMQRLAGLIKEIDGISTKINFNLPENTDVKDFAKAVAYELRESYGTHNYDAFFRVLQSELQEDDSDLYPGTMGDEMSAPTSI